jgi:hypothetical protein
MQWYKQQQSIDEAIRSTVYPGLANTEAEGIDLRLEMTYILYGNAFKKPLGHWVVLRHFDRSQHSNYWNPISKEGVNGPAHPYTDVLLRTRRIPYPRNDTENVSKAGDIFSDKLVYYFEYDVSISMGDQIYELDVVDHTRVPDQYNFTEKYDVKRLHPYRLENGNVQYFAALSEFNNITY